MRHGECLYDLCQVMMVNYELGVCIADLQFWIVLTAGGHRGDMVWFGLCRDPSGEDTCLNL